MAAVRLGSQITWASTRSWVESPPKRAKLYVTPAILAKLGGRTSAKESQYSSEGPEWPMPLMGSLAGGWDMAKPVNVSAEMGIVQYEVSWIRLPLLGSCIVGLTR